MLPYVSGGAANTGETQARIKENAKLTEPRKAPRQIFMAKK